MCTNVEILFIKFVVNFSPLLSVYIYCTWYIERDKDEIVCMIYKEQSYSSFCVLNLTL